MKLDMRLNMVELCSSLLTENRKSVKLRIYDLWRLYNEIYGIVETIDYKQTKIAIGNMIPISFNHKKKRKRVKISERHLVRYARILHCSNLLVYPVRGSLQKEIRL